MLRSLKLILFTYAFCTNAVAVAGPAACSDRFVASRAQDSVVAMAYASGGAAIAAAPYFVSQWFAHEELGSIGEFSGPVKFSMVALGAFASWAGLKAYQDYHFGNLVIESIRGSERGTVNMAHRKLARYFNRSLYAPMRVSWRNPKARLSKAEREQQRLILNQRTVTAQDIFSVTQQLMTEESFCERDISPAGWILAVVEKFRVTP